MILNVKVRALKGQDHHETWNMKNVKNAIYKIGQFLLRDWLINARIFHIFMIGVRFSRVPATVFASRWIFDKAEVWFARTWAFPEQ